MQIKAGNWPGDRYHGHCLKDRRRKADRMTVNDLIAVGVATGDWCYFTVWIVTLLI
jgi:hypothetical protein